MRARLAAFTAIALGFGAAYALITPAFEVPDEVGHYWRATSVAYGHVVVGKKVGLPRGDRVIIWALQLADGEHLDADRLRKARGVMLQDEYRDPTPIAGLYTPAAYVPQIIAATVTRVERIRPYYAFFAGRLATLVFCIALVVVACWAAPEFAGLFEAVALLPMSLFLFGSWSADALTIVVAFLATAFILRAMVRPSPPSRRDLVLIVAAVAWLSFCKPPYVLMALMAVAVPARRAFRALVVAVMIAGTVISAAMTMTGMAMPGPRYRPMDARQQLRFIASDPLHFAWVIAHDVRTNAKDYLESMTGRLGRHELKLPISITVLLWLILAVVGMSTGPPLPLRSRVLVVAIAIAVAFATLTYLYLTSSIVGGDVIEGTQGRYVLPLLPLLLTTLRLPRLRIPNLFIAVYAIAIAANIAGIIVLRQRFY